MQRYWYRLPGSFHAMGPTEPVPSEAAARAAIREAHGLNRLPAGSEVWLFAGHATELNMRQRRELTACGLCVTD